MIRTTFQAAVVAFALFAGPATAVAADIQRGSAPYYAPSAPLPAYSWMGPYIGVNLGYQWGLATNSGANPDGFAGGLEGGYNWQTGQFVYGLETDLQLSGSNDTFAGWKFSNPWFGTLRGRAGVAMNNVLLYATLGLAYGNGTIDVGTQTETKTHFGWAGGAGMEVGPHAELVGKGRILFVDLSDRRYVLFGNTGFESSILRFGVNYRF